MKVPPLCPCCSEECDTYYFDRFGNIIGCENCITHDDAIEHWDEDFFVYDHKCAYEKI